jgi:peptidyl-prolyl cis-trans isomerase A (cyclophilin A)
MRLTAIALMMLALVLIAAAPQQVAAQVNVEKLMNPAQLTEKAPDKYQVKFDTSKGEFVVEVTREWAPIGADRFYNLVKYGFYDNCKFFRNIEGFMVQFGMNGNPKIGAAWRSVPIKDDPVNKSNLRGYITFAKTSAPNSRTTQVFINFGDNTNLDKDGFAPFGKVVKGMNVVESLYNKYGGKPGNDQQQIATEGNAFLEKTYPNLDSIKTATILPAEAK